jgi:hypothetical protein
MGSQELFAMVRHQRRLTPVILATQEEEIRKIKVQSHPGEIIHKTPTETHHRKGLKV